MWDVLEARPLFSSALEPGEYSDSLHLAHMVSFMGPPPQKLLDRGHRASHFFGPEGIMAPITAKSLLTQRQDV